VDISQGSKLVLASGSPRRAQILADAGFDFDVVPAEIDEDEILLSGGDLNDVVQRVALAKAEMVACEFPGEFVLGADTIVVLDGEVLGKPATNSEATNFLRRLSGRHHEVITGVAVTSPTGESVTSSVSTSVSVRALGDGEISEYVSSGLPFDKAGGYGIQDQSFSPVESYDGCYLNVVGLPICGTSDLLKQSGFILSAALECAGHSARVIGRGVSETGSTR
jgi:MAF protein